MEREEKPTIEPEDALPKEDAESSEPAQSDPDTDHVVEEKQRED